MKRLKQIQTFIQLLTNLNRGGVNFPRQILTFAKLSIFTSIVGDFLHHPLCGEPLFLCG